MEEAQRNVVVSMFAGLVFAVGWWIFIGFWDNQLNHLTTAMPIMNATGKINGTLRGEIIAEIYNPLWGMCCVGTIGLIMVNTVANSVVQGDGFDVDGQTCLARLYIFTGFMCLFSTVIASIWVGAATYAGSDGTASPYRKSSLGYALMGQNILIFLAAVIFKFFRTESAWGGY